MRRLVGVIVAMGVAAAAFAQDAPPVRPVRDVVVEYRPIGMGENGGGAITMHFANKGGRIRIDSPDGGFVAFDSATDRTLIVIAPNRSYMDVATDPAQRPPFFAPHGGLVKSGTATVAGARCSIYDARINGQDGQLCLTDDGVLLRVESGGRRMEAVRVSFDAQPASLFEPPAGFRKTEPPRPRRGMTDDGPPNPPRGSYWGIQTGR